MCGIAGLHGWDLGRAELQRALEQMCASIAHRGPDDRGTMVADSIGLGMTRLSIIEKELDALRAREAKLESILTEEDEAALEAFSHSGLQLV